MRCGRDSVWCCRTRSCLRERWRQIRLGSDWIDDAQMERAAEDVNVADFIRTLPRASSEPVTERGATLSTGQKQLISFARALAHAPGILILDEATSSVDTETELRVRAALERMITGRTSVLIAHRLSTIQRADTILVMHKGQLREQGSHQELLLQRGLYWKLYQLQYRDQELGSAPPPRRQFRRIELRPFRPNAGLRRPPFRLGRMRASGVW